MEWNIEKERNFIFTLISDACFRSLGHDRDFEIGIYYRCNAKLYVDIGKKMKVIPWSMLDRRFVVKGESEQARLRDHMLRQLKTNFEKLYNEIYTRYSFYISFDIRDFKEKWIDQSWITLRLNVKLSRL